MALNDKKTRSVAVMQLGLILPACLFLAAVLITAGDQPPQYDLARLAQSLVNWYSVRAWTLFLFLLALPVASLVTGGVTLLAHGNRGGDVAHPGEWSMTAPIATLIVGWATITSAGILAVVAMHIAAN